MCGRFNLSTPAHVLARMFGLIDIPNFEPRFNIAPTQMIAVIRAPQHAETNRQLEFMHWGLIPRWAKDPTIGNKMINARAETIDEKPAYKNAFKRRRCLIPADSFFEWKKLNPDEKFQFGSASKKGIAKQPLAIALTSNEPLALAGLWEHWQDPQGTGTEIISTTIITTAANEIIKPIHDRMPVIVEQENWARWLAHDPEERTTAQDFADILQPYPGELHHWFVTRQMNSPKFTGPQCVQPIERAGDAEPTLF